MLKNVLVVAEWTPNFEEHFAPLVSKLKAHHGNVSIIGLFYVSKFATDVIDNAQPNVANFDDILIIKNVHNIRKIISDLRCLLATYVFIKPSSGYLSGSSGDLELYQIIKRVIPGAIILLRTQSYLDRYLDNNEVFDNYLVVFLNRLKKREAAICAKITIIYIVFFVLLAGLRLLKRRKKKTELHKILFIRLDALGDMVLSLPAILALREYYSQSEITLLVSKRSGAIIEEQQRITPKKFCDRLIFWDAPWNEDRENLQGIKAFFRIIGILPILFREKYDVVIQPVELGTGVLFAKLFCADMTVATIAERLPLSRMMEKHVQAVKFLYYEQHHIADLPNRLVSQLTSSQITNKYLHHCITVDSDDVKLIQREFAQRGWDGKSIIVSINLGAGHQRRKWSSENYAKLIEISNKELSLFPVIIGGASEIELGRTTQELLKFTPASFVGELSLNQLAALLSMSDVVVTPDTGVMHMAAALDKKIVAIFGAGLVPFCHPICSNYIIVKHELGCSGCNDVCFTAGNPPCIRQVTVEMVYSAVRIQLGLDS